MPVNTHCAMAIESYRNLLLPLNQQPCDQTKPLLEICLIAVTVMSNMKWDVHNPGIHIVRMEELTYKALIKLSRASSKNGYCLHVLNTS